MGYLFSEEFTAINDKISVLKKDTLVCYYLDKNLIYTHMTGDKIAFQFIICQLFLSGLAKQKELIDAFDLSKSTIIRWINKFRKEGAIGFLKENKPLRIQTSQKKKPKKRKQKEILNILGETSSIKKDDTRKLYL